MAKKKSKKGTGLFTKGSNDYVIWIVVIMLLALGLIMVLSASSATSLAESGDSYRYFKKQLISAIIGLVGMIALSRIDYKIYKRFAGLIYGVIVILLFAVKVFGMESGGAKRWINIAGFNFQPSELAKLALIIFFASLLTKIKEEGKIKSLFKGVMLPLLALVPIIIAIYVFQNHFSATFIICAVTLIQMLVAGIRVSHLILLGTIALGFFGIYISKKSTGGNGSFRMTRIQTWLNPWNDITGDGWQIVQSLYAIGSGGLFGSGLGQSKQKYLYLPEPQNDFIFAVLAEELGYVGCLAVIILFIVFVWRGILIAMNARDTFGSLLAIGIVSMIGLQAIINIAVVTNTMPVTGMELPFFSYGGTAIIVNLLSVGILLNISRSSKLKEK